MRRLRMWWRGWRYHRGWHPAFAGQAPEQDFYGSMDYESERALYWPAPTRWEMAHEHSGWWGQTTADLAPEALDGGPTVSGPEGATGVNAPSVQFDSGPGAGSSLAPGPDTARLAWLDRQLASHAAWTRRMRGQVTGWSLEAAA